MTADPTPTASADRVVLRSAQRQWLGLGWLAIALVSLLLHFTAVPSESLALAAFFAVLSVVSFAVAGWIALVLTPEGLVDRGITMHRLSWSNIQSLDETQNIATRYVVIRTTDGRTHQLRLPTVALGTGAGRFSRDLATLRQYWLAHR